VTCDADPSFYRRLAGRIETGRHSVSDPAMGLQDRF
jgi:phospholipase C